MRAALCLLVVVAACSGRPSSVSSRTTAGADGTVLRPDQTQVTGTVTGAHIVGLTAPLALPITVTVPTRGNGGLRIIGVSAEGRAESVSWDAGQPLPLTGSGSVDLQQVAVDVGGSNLTWHLDGTPRLLGPGHYIAGSAVAVGRAGLAQAVDRAAFDVPAGRAGQLTSLGDARVVQPFTRVTMRGPGSVAITGSLSAETAAGARVVHQVTLRSGSFEISFFHSPGGLIVTSLLQGDVVAS